MSLSCYIIDDESHAVEHLRALVNKTPGLDLLGSFTSSLTALEELSGKGMADIIFSDIDMPDLNGLDLAGLIGRDSRVVFTTSYREFAPEAFELAAADYLLKPITYPRFLNCIDKIRRTGNPAAGPKSFFIKTGTRSLLTRIGPEEILYIAGLEAYVEIYLKNQKLVTYIGLAEVLDRLPSNFSRIHKSYIVNDDFITGIDHDQVLLPGNIRLTIGRAYKEAFYKKIGPSLLISKRA
jgi:two-component system LytT family response regulator